MDNKKSQALVAILGASWGFMLWWWLISSGGFLGLLISLLIGAVVGGVTWFVMGLLA